MHWNKTFCNSAITGCDTNHLWNLAIHEGGKPGAKQSMWKGFYSALG